MKPRLLCLLALSGALLAGTTVAAQPDFNSVWSRYPDPNGGRDPRFAEETPPPGGEPPLREPYATAYKLANKKRLAAEAAGRPLADNLTRCLPEGMPNMMQDQIEIVQTPKKILVLVEFLMQARRIFMNEKMPPPDEISPSFNGYSIGRWEGETLVVETRGVREDVTIWPWQIPHSSEMVMTERWRLTGPDLMENQITIVDPKVFTRPYRYTYGYKKDPVNLGEYVCENHRDVIDAHGQQDMRIDP